MGGKFRVGCHFYNNSRVYLPYVGRMVSEGKPKTGSLPGMTPFNATSIARQRTFYRAESATRQGYNEVDPEHTDLHKMKRIIAFSPYTFQERGRVYERDLPSG